MQKHNESENKFTYSVPTFNRFNTLRDENPDFQRKQPFRNLRNQQAPQSLMKNLGELQTVITIQEHLTK